MFDNLKVVQSAESSVKKLVLTKADAVAETVLYRYPTYEGRTVICCQLWFVQDWMAKNSDKARPSIGCGLPKIHAPVQS